MNLSCSDCSQSASDRCSSTPPGEEPALLTRMSTRPSALWPCATKFLASASLLRSAGDGTTRRVGAPAVSAAPPPLCPFPPPPTAAITAPFAHPRGVPFPLPPPPPVAHAGFPPRL